MPLTFSEKVYLRAADIEIWVERGSYRMPSNTRIAKILRGTGNRPIIAKRFLRKTRGKGYAPAAFNYVQLPEAVPPPLLKKLSEEIQIRRLLHSKDWNVDSEINLHDEEHKMCRKPASYEYSRPYGELIQECAELAHSHLEKALREHCRHAKTVDTLRMLSLFEKTTNPRNPTAVSALFYAKNEESGLSEYCNKVSVWGTVIVCIQDGDCSELQDGLQVRNLKANEEDLSLLLSGDVVIISPTAHHSVPAVIRKRAKYSIVVSF